MSVFRKAMVYLGLVDDESLDDDAYYADQLEEEAPAPAATRAPARAGAARSSGRAPASAEGGPVTVIRSQVEEAPPPASAPRAQAPRPVAVPTATARVHVMEPHGFNDAQELGDRLRNGQPVILNLQGADRDLQRRLIDFSSGLAYGLGGTMSKAAEQVFLITPSNVEVSDEEKERLQARGLYRTERA